MRSKFYDVRKRFLCGDLACLVKCGCSTIMAAWAALNELDSNERDILMYELCGTCAVVPGGQVGSASFADCLRKMLERLCTPDKQAAIRLARASIDALENIMPPVPPYDKIFRCYKVLLDGILLFCSNPTNDGVAQLLAAICTCWTTVKDQNPADIGGMGPTAGPLGATLAQIFTDDVKAAISDCCATFQAVGGVPNPGSLDLPVPPATGGTVPGAGVGIPSIPGLPGGTPGTRIPQPINSGVINALRPWLQPQPFATSDGTAQGAQEALGLGPQQPWNDARQFFGSPQDMVNLLRQMGNQ